MPSSTMLPQMYKNWDGFTINDILYQMVCSVFEAAKKDLKEL